MKSAFTKNWWRWLIVAACALAVAFVPVPQGITREAWMLLAIFTATIVGSILQPVAAGAVVFLGVVATIAFGALPLESALKGYSDKVVWLVLAAFFLSRAMIKTGFGHRIALLFVRAIGKKTLGLGYSLVATDFLLGSFVPSNAARAGGIILPIARSVSETYDSYPDGKSNNRLGAFLMNLIYQCDVIVCATFITGQASNLIIANLVRDNAGVQLTYSSWLAASIVPAIFSFVAVPFLIYKFFPPEIKDTPKATEFADSELARLGKLSWQEITVGVVFLGVVILWITQRWHGIDTTVVALLGVCALLLSNVLSWKDLISETGAWEVFIWYGGLVRMAEALGEAKLTTLFAEKMASFTVGMSWMLALAVLVLVYFYAHYAFASITAHVTAMLIPFLLVTVAVGAPAGLVILLLAYFSNLSASLTHYGTTPAPMYFGTGYVKQKTWWTIGFLASVVNILIWSVVGLIWWKLLGWW